MFLRLARTPPILMYLSNSQLRTDAENARLTVRFLRNRLAAWR